MRNTATDLRPPPPPWTANPQTPAQLSTHTIGSRRRMLARTATTTSAWTPSPRNPTSTRGRQRWQQRRCLPSGPGVLLHLCYCNLASDPDPRPMEQHGSWPRCSHVSRMGEGVVGVVHACARGIRPAACVSLLYCVFYIDSPECYRSH